MVMYIPKHKKHNFYYLGGTPFAILLLLLYHTVDDKNLSTPWVVRKNGSNVEQ